jgi:hypothetical protein
MPYRAAASKQKNLRKLLILNAILVLIARVSFL